MHCDLIVTIEVLIEIFGDVDSDLVEPAFLVELAVAVNGDGPLIGLSLEAQENLSRLFILGLSEASINSQVNEVSVLALTHILNTSGEFTLSIKLRRE
jgi:hypothetical protein